MEGLRAALAPKYTVDAVYHLHNPILLQRFYVALHDFQLRQSKGKKCASQNVRVKFHGSSECLSIIKHGFNRAIQVCGGVWRAVERCGGRGRGCGEDVEGCGGVVEGCGGL